MKHLILPFLTIGLMILTGCQQTVAGTAGLKDGKLQPCPDKPNCVCTQDRLEQHRIEPLRYDITQDEARDKLLRVIRSMERSTLVQR